MSTTGSLLGCARRMREVFPALQVVAADAVGSVIFGGAGALRDLPGIGSSRVPERHSPDEIDRVEHVDDATAAEACRYLDRVYDDGWLARARERRTEHA